MSRSSAIAVWFDSGRAAGCCRAGRLTVLGSLLAAACTGPGFSTGPLQPQSVSGPCTVKNFYLVILTSTTTDMAVDSTPRACVFTMIDPDLQELQNVAWVTGPASHGQATAGLANSGRSARVTYTPAPGYAGPDRFTVTVEPRDRAVTVNVTVRAAAAKPL